MTGAGRATGGGLMGWYNPTSQRVLIDMYSISTCTAGFKTANPVVGFSSPLDEADFGTTPVITFAVIFSSKSPLLPRTPMWLFFFAVPPLAVDRNKSTNSSMVDSNSCVTFFSCALREASNTLSSLFSSSYNKLLTASFFAPCLPPAGLALSTVASCLDALIVRSKTFRRLFMNASPLSAATANPSVPAPVRGSLKANTVACTEKLCDCKSKRCSFDSAATCASGASRNLCVRNESR
mmetsp:Transcript_19541/g.26826  ORF Transcript_19541/g.26826 Transcript_19541/m.26826 type:complete len:237 (-) Transcript_19541:1471-2181(-)